MWNGIEKVNNFWIFKSIHLSTLFLFQEEDIDFSSAFCGNGTNIVENKWNDIANLV